MAQIVTSLNGGDTGVLLLRRTPEKGTHHRRPQVSSRNWREFQFAYHRTVEAIAPAVGATFTYQYDFGDRWQHLVTLERLVPFVGGVDLPYCLEGARACPPEDVAASRTARDKRE